MMRLVFFLLGVLAIAAGLWLADVGTIVSWQDHIAGPRCLAPSSCLPC
jgi:hypothetical protein